MSNDDREQEEKDAKLSKEQLAEDEKRIQKMREQYLKEQQKKGKK